MRWLHKRLPGLSVALLALVLITAGLAVGLWAKYRTTQQSTDSARVAAFQIKETGTITQELSVDIVPGETFPVNVDILNKSEVAVAYTVTIANKTNNLSPLRYSLTENDTAAATLGSATVTLTADTLPAGESSQGLTLYISWPEGENDLSYMGKIDYVTLAVTATQID